MSIKNLLISCENTVMQVMRKINKTGHNCMIVIDKKKKFRGTITDGDIRRYILKKNNLATVVEKIYNRRSLYLKKNQKISKKINKFLNDNQHLIVPILNENKTPVDFLTYRKINKIKKEELENNQIIIMAGGKGTRMRPFTEILPKPLVPLNGKPMILNIMDNFKKYNFNNFLITISKKEKILNTFLNQFKNNYNFSFYEEIIPLGTAGYLKKINLKNDFFLVNCDTYLDINLNNLLKFHKSSKSIITIVACMKTFNLSFGECIVDKFGKLKEIKEKPKKNYITNTGLYLMKPEVKDYLPKKNKYGVDELITSVLNSKKKISVFPIQEQDWKDTGTWWNYIEKNKR